MLHGARHPVITATLLRGYADRMRDFEIETVDDAGHWIVEQQPGLVLDRLQAFLAGASAIAATISSGVSERERTRMPSSPETAFAICSCCRALRTISDPK
jgi:hypothetical protein